MSWQQTPSGLLVRGHYTWRRNREPWRIDHNLVVDEGIDAAYDLGISGTPGSWYMAPYSDDATPAAGWNAATFASSVSELGDPPEGYSQTTRQVWTPDVETTGLYRTSAYLTNATYPTEFKIRSASQIQVTGFALLSDDTKLSTSGVMLSAVRFGTGPQMFDNGDILVVRYTLETRRSP